MSTTNKKSGTRNKNKNEQLFSEGQLRQLATLIETIIDKKLEPIKRDISILKDKSLICLEY